MAEATGRENQAGWFLGEGLSSEDVCGVACERVSVRMCKESVTLRQQHTSQFIFTQHLSHVTQLYVYICTALDQAFCTTLPCCKTLDNVVGKKKRQ